MQAGVDRAVEIHLGGTAGIVTEETETVVANDHMSNRFAMEEIISRGRYAVLSDDLLRAQAVEIVFEFDFPVGLAHFFGWCAR